MSWNLVITSSADSELGDEQVLDFPLSSFRFMKPSLQDEDRRDILGMICSKTMMTMMMIMGWDGRNREA